MATVVLATLATNIAANVVSPANDFANLAPRLIGFRTGGLITGVVGVAMMPWKLIADPNGYIFTWLIGSSAVLGAAGGVMIADYWIIRRTRLDVAAPLRNRRPLPLRRRHSTGVRSLRSSSRSPPCVPGFYRHLTNAVDPKRPLLVDHLYDHCVVRHVRHRSDSFTSR